MAAIRHEEYMRRMARGPIESDVAKEDHQDEMVYSPPHYNQAGIEAIDAIRAATGDGYEYHLQGTAIKYLWRYRYKNGLQDLMKCRWYLDKLIREDQKRD